MVWAVALGSCQDPAYRAKQAVRDGRIDRTVMLHLAREQAGPKKLEELAELDRELQKRNAEHLEKTWKRIHERHQRDYERWIEMWPRREKELRKLMEDDFENMAETWRKMVY